jgi:hypothetical protein
MRRLCYLQGGYELLVDPDNCVPWFRSAFGGKRRPRELGGFRIVPLLVTALIRAEGRYRKARDIVGTNGCLNARLELEAVLKEAACR